MYYEQDPEDEDLEDVLDEDLEQEETGSSPENLARKYSQKRKTPRSKATPSQNNSSTPSKGPSIPNLPSSSGRTLKSKVAKSGANALKTTGKVVAQSLTKAIAVIASNPLVIVAVILVIAIIVAIIHFAIGDRSLKNSINPVDEYIKAIVVDNEDANMELKDIYTGYKSLLLVKPSDMDLMYKKFEEYNKSTNSLLLNGMSIKYSGKELYKHILETEKTNFNKMEWSEQSPYEDSMKKITDNDIHTDADYGLKYPKKTWNITAGGRTRGEVENSLGNQYRGEYYDIASKDQFVRDARPYLQTWYIPLSMLAGTLQQGSESNKEKLRQNADLTYQIINEAYSKISWNKYDLKKIVNIRTVDGCTGKVHDSWDGEINTQYYVAEARTFDKIVKNEFKYEKAVYTERVSSYEKKCDDDSTGTTVVTTKRWEDRASISNTQERMYEIYDIESFVQGKEGEPIVEQPTEEIISEESKEYYEEVKKKSGLDRIMLINSKPEIYEKYVSKNSVHMKNVGVSKSFLATGYYFLKKNLQGMSSNKNDLPVAYGQTLGINLNYSGRARSDGSIDGYNIPGAGAFIWPVPSNLSNGSLLRSRSSNDESNGGLKYDRSKGVITSEFGVRVFSAAEFHGAIDIISNVKKADVVAAASGTVTKAVKSCVSESNMSDSCGGGYGNQVYIDHGNGFITHYSHLAPGSVQVNVNDSVTQGQVIGKIGSTGRSTGDHLDFEVRVSSDNLKTTYINMDEAKYGNSNRGWSSKGTKEYYVRRSSSGSVDERNPGLQINPILFYNEDLTPKQNSIISTDSSQGSKSEMIEKAKKMAEAKKIAYSQSKRQTATTKEELDNIKYMDCSSFIYSMFKSYLDIDVGANTERILQKAEEGINKEDWQVEIGIINNNDYSSLQPGDILWRPGHAGIYVGNDMQVDQGGDGNTEALDWKGPLYHSVKNAGYTKYIRYSQPSTAPVVNGEPGMNAKQLLKLGDNIASKHKLYTSDSGDYPVIRQSANYYGDLFGIDPYIILAAVLQESGANKSANGAAAGLLQLEKSVYLNAASIVVKDINGNNVTINYPKSSELQSFLNDIDWQMKVGVAKYRQSIDNHQNNILVALQAYNMGAGGIRRCISHYISGGKGSGNYFGVSEQKYLEYIASNKIGWMNSLSWYKSTGHTVFGNAGGGDPNYLSNIFRYYNTESDRLPYIYERTSSGTRGKVISIANQL